MLRIIIRGHCDKRNTKPFVASMDSICAALCDRQVMGNISKKMYFLVLTRLVRDLTVCFLRRKGSDWYVPREIDLTI